MGPGKKVKISRVLPNCDFDDSKPGSVGVRALRALQPDEEYLVDYGEDSVRMMFGLPLPGNKRLRSIEEKDEQEKQVKPKSDRQNEKRLAVLKELDSLKS